MTDSVVTTGSDVVEETRAFNVKLAAALAAEPKPYDIGVAESRRRREQGEGLHSVPVRLPEGLDRTVPGRAGDVPVRVLRPADVRGVLLHVHGGGWTFGSADGQDTRLWELAQAAKLAVVSVGYRRAPEDPHPAAADDVEDAARWLITAASAEFGTDRLAIAGESAGAHLAALTLVRLGDRARAFRAAQLTYGAYDLSMTPSQRLGTDKLLVPTDVLAWFRDQLLPGRSAEERRDPAVSPLYADLRGMPPARFVAGTEDPLLDDSLFMAARWRAAGNVAELEVVADATHGFLNLPITITKRERARQAEYLAAAVS
ncbi:alpha/beta hydrolase fold domain-containing protein [Actinomadura madurae]|uniref:alpha/beta hydrolase fold domain-containing protein n=1 Tax=Actinomadura madurae TaxID=1993 RepID=UPI00202705E3|nr:alpha/beta hydrolase fold domain-containing protein [Actinomadura madurae]MCP9951757.1 alpha/beta hydrolase [Actinomadura madurae]MCP9968527.1 alpha/beta hydrolase [Actinomadura madurae]MCP9980996.1 alpha/beta hydrolase [Actinomadura madurae]MCQ0007504.1 alpha/beta hydrolase [Actinomadura madurae]URM97196.1 alpha/beta hydrolase [Actinomadura madurae]